MSSSVPPEEPEQIRGETLEPVSPKPLHYPSPSNIPILGASMDPAFSDTVMQTMQQQSEPLPSVAQHTIPITNPDLQEPILSSNKSPEDAHMMDGNVEGINNTSSDSAQASMSDPAVAEHEDTSPDPNFLPSEPLKPSDTDETPSAVDISAPPEDASIDVPAPVDAAPPIPADAASFLPPKPADSPAAGNVDYSAILANLSSIIPGATPVSSNATSAAQAPSNVISPASASVSAFPGLPPKPPAQDKPNMHPNYTPGDDLRNYHPHAQNNGNGPAPAAALPNLNTNGLPPPPHAYQTPLSAVPGSAMSAPSNHGQAPQDDEDAPFDPHVQQLYDQFIQFERQNVHEGQWDKFPMGSRLFVGNLSTEKVQKKDVFRKFYKYGQLAQISIKQAYGFVQFMDAATCSTALAMEQGTKIRGREIHLEVSKPAKSTNRQQQDRTRRRSRSPDYGRRGGQQIDRYSGSPRDRDNRRSRDEWRRSPSPRRSYGGRDDRYDRRRRSPSPYGARDRYSNSTPQQQRDELDLPWRAPGQAPDIQILVVDQLDQEYVRWVDNAMKSRGVRVDVLMLTPRWPEEAVVRRQILEGVLAVVHLTRADRMMNKVSLRLFNRSGGNNNVTFDQYVDLDPTTAADLVLRAKQTQAQPAPPPPPQNYSIPPQQRNPPPPSQQYSPFPPSSARPSQQQQTYPPPSNNPADISRIMSSLSAPGAAPPPGTNPDLARIMAGIGSQSRPGQSPSATGITPDVARLLGQMGQPPPTQQHPVPGSYQSTPAPAPASMPSSYPSATPVSAAAPMQPPTSQNSPDIQQLLANLTNYKPPS